MGKLSSISFLFLFFMLAAVVFLDEADGMWMFSSKYQRLKDKNDDKRKKGSSSHGAGGDDDGQKKENKLKEYNKVAVRCNRSTTQEECEKLKDHGNNLCYWNANVQNLDGRIGQCEPSDYAKLHSHPNIKANAQILVAFFPCSFFLLAVILLDEADGMKNWFSSSKKGYQKLEKKGDDNGQKKANPTAEKNKKKFNFCNEAKTEDDCKSEAKADSCYWDSNVKHEDGRTGQCLPKVYSYDVQRGSRK